MTVWIDVEDLFDFAARHARPGGIQRVVFEIASALARSLPAAELGLVRHARERDRFCVVPSCELAALYAGLASGPAGVAAQLPPRSRGSWRSAIGAGLRRARRLPPSVRFPLESFYLHQRAALSALGRAVMVAGSAAVRRVRPARPATAPPPPRSAADAWDRMIAPGDVLLALGTPWLTPGYAARVARARRRGLRFALLIHDIIPARHPEWFDPALLAAFADGMHRVIPQADAILTVSRATAADLARFAATAGIPLAATPGPIAMGAGFAAPSVEHAAPTRRPAAPYVLCVSTIEARKNHALLLRVWHRLLRDLPADDVPTLVFAGRIGSLTQDVVAQARIPSFLSGKLVVIEDATDPDLASLYRGCMFTVYPSLYEGWGLPVTESFRFGRPAIISRATSLPEAGGRLARYFDPDSATDAYNVIRHAIVDRAGLALWQANVASEFRPVSWDQTAASVLDAVTARGANLAAPAHLHAAD